MSDASNPVTGAQQFRCQDYVFELLGESELVAELEALFLDLATISIAKPHAWTIEVDREQARVVIDGDDVKPWVNSGNFAAHVISTLTIAMIAGHSSKLHAHAASVVHDGRSMLLVAPSGSGKSTLTCALVAAGAQYRTDEAVAIDPDRLDIVTFPKPISVKKFGIQEVKRLTGLSPPHGATTWEIAASSFGSVAADGDYPVTTIAFNSYTPSEPTCVEPLHRASAVHRILSDSQDTEMHGPKSLAVVAGLTRTAQCLRVAGSDSADVARALLEAHQLVVDPGELTMVEPPLQGLGRARRHDVCSVVIDGRAVLYTPEPYRLVELDDAQTLWWLLLDGTRFDDTVDEIVHATGSPRASVVATGRACIEGFQSLDLLSSP
ncbi:MAG: hypothetical protein ACKVIQ_07895 [Acidimicrobiales bacterium]